MNRIEISDALWEQERAEFGWTLPRPATAVLRLPLIRWFRFVAASIKVHKAARRWASIGLGLGRPNQYDKWVLWAIYRGWC